jgi:hypothetical protein
LEDTNGQAQGGGDHEDAEIIEVSTPQLDDVVRLEDRYGSVGDTAP